MSKANAAPRQRIPNPLSKEERARDAAVAMREYQAEQKAVRDRTARLREMRLAKEAAHARNEKPQKRVQKKSVP